MGTDNISGSPELSPSMKDELPGSERALLSAGDVGADLDLLSLFLLFHSGGFFVLGRTFFGSGTNTRPNMGRNPRATLFSSSNNSEDVINNLHMTSYLLLRCRI
jgi:hypothetical protein